MIASRALASLDLRHPHINDGMSVFSSLKELMKSFILMKHSARTLKIIYRRLRSRNFTALQLGLKLSVAELGA